MVVVDSGSIDAISFVPRSRSAVKYTADENPLERLRVIGEYMSDLDAIVKQRHKENPGLTD